MIDVETMNSFTLFHSSLIGLLCNYYLFQITCKIKLPNTAHICIFKILILILLLRECLITNERRCRFKLLILTKENNGHKTNSSTAQSGSILTYCSNLFSHMASSSLALRAIVTHAAQQKLSLAFASIPDVDT